MKSTKQEDFALLPRCFHGEYPVFGNVWDLYYILRFWKFQLEAVVPGLAKPTEDAVLDV